MNCAFTSRRRTLQILLPSIRQLLQQPMAQLFVIVTEWHTLCPLYVLCVGMAGSVVVVYASASSMLLDTMMS